MSLTKSQIIISAAVGFVALIVVLIFLGVIPGLQTQTTDSTKTKATLNFWGVGENSSSYSGFIADFKKTYPNITITYKNFSDPDTYNTALLDALASGQGPDIFTIKNTDLLKNVNKIIPVPSAGFSSTQLKQYFPQIVSQDFTYQNNIYALPLSIDTLALIYNRNIFDQAVVPTPLNWQSWDDFVNAVPKLVKKDSDNKITQSAAALGASSNITNATDILYLLMLQNGVQMNNSQTNSILFASDKGAAALDFFSQFSNPSSKNYSWDKSLPNSFDYFGQGKLAMVFGYATQLPQIKSRNNLLNFEIAPIPQPKGATAGISYPNYWGYAVSKQSKYQNIAWSFILDLTTNETIAKDYAQKNQRPPALNSLIYQFQNDPVLGVFARQALTARSWIMLDSSFINKTVSDMINSMIESGQKSKNALGQAQNQINQYLNGKVF